MRLYDTQYFDSKTPWSCIVIETRSHLHVDRGKYARVLEAGMAALTAAVVTSWQFSSADLLAHCPWVVDQVQHCGSGRATTHQLAHEHLPPYRLRVFDRSFFDLFGPTLSPDEPLRHGLSSILILLDHALLEHP